MLIYFEIDDEIQEFSFFIKNKGLFWFRNGSRKRNW